VGHTWRALKAVLQMQAPKLAYMPVEVDLQNDLRCHMIPMLVGAVVLPSLVAPTYPSMAIVRGGSRSSHRPWWKSSERGMLELNLWVLT